MWRDGLYFILYSYGVKGKLLRMVRLWHEGATAVGLWYKAQSNKIQFSQGVRQGCVIAPLLYVAFINPLTGHVPDLTHHPCPELAACAFAGGLDREEGLNVRLRASEVALSVPALLYCDDVCLLAPSQASLQANLDIYAAYVRKWRYSLNPNKFHVVSFGRGAVGDEAWTVKHPKGDVHIVSEPHAEYLGAVLDKQRSSLEHVRQAGVKAAKQSGLLSRIAHNIGEEAASLAQNRKVDPSCLYGLAASWASDNNLDKLDELVTAKCNSRAHLLPKNARKEVALYESDTLCASSKVTLDQARLAIKLVRDPNPIRKALLTELSGPRPPARTGQTWARAQRALRATGVQLVPSSNPPSRNRARKVLAQLDLKLRAQQQRALSTGLPLAPTQPNSLGRGSIGLFNHCAAPMKVGSRTWQYCEWRKLSAVNNPSHRRSVRKIRTGQLDCATRRAQWAPRAGAPPSLQCACGAQVEDPYHVVMECPHTRPVRTAVLDSVRAHAVTDSQLSSLIAGQEDLSVLHASLGASLPGPWKQVSTGPYSTLVGLAGPIWSKGLTCLF